MAHFRLTIKYLYIFLIDTPISFLYLNDANYCLGNVHYKDITCMIIYFSLLYVIP